MPIKVLFITHYSGLYGANRSLLQLVEDLRCNHDIEPHVIVLEEGVLINHLIKEHIPFTKLKYYHWLNGDTYLKSQIKKVLNFFLLPYAIRKLKGIIKNMDIIHSNSSVSNLGGLLSKKFSIPHAWHIREYGLDDYNLKYQMGIKSAGKFYNQHANQVLAISQDLKDYYSAYIQPDKIEVVYNGIKKVPPFIKKYHEQVNICVLGVISENKNQIEVIHAINWLIKEMNISHFKLNIIGEGEPTYKKLLETLVKELNIEQYVNFHGYLPDAVDALRHMDLAVVPSRREAFGRVTVEFMMNKIPVVASDSGANSEIISSPTLGELYELGNFKELAYKMSIFLDDKEKIKRVAENAYQYAIENFSSELNAKKIFHIYSKILNIKY